MDHIIFTGGNTKLKNFKLRVLEEFDNYWNDDDKNDTQKLTEFNMEVDPQFISLYGLFLASFIIKDEDYITKKEYEEYGAYNAFVRNNINKLDYFL